MSDTLLIEVLFWIAAGTTFYSYLGYGLLVWLLIAVKRWRKAPLLQPQLSDKDLPRVTLFIAAYNERDYVEQKMMNTEALDYPKRKLEVFWITDGSDDGTPDLLASYKRVTVLHEKQRRGKVIAINRGMLHVETPITIFSDANTQLNPGSIRELVRHFQDKKVGCVAGEKRISKSPKSVTGTGEGLYWRYESILKKWDAELYSTMGAAGELFAIRTSLFTPLLNDTILDDFTLSFQIARKGYRIMYAPTAYSEESPSADVRNEMKRKIRIASGGIQAFLRLTDLLNIFKYGILSFQYISHRILRWIVVPQLLPLLLILNFYLLESSSSHIYRILWFVQLIAYSLGLFGALFSKKVPLKIISIPYYFIMMNFSAWVALLRYRRGKKQVVWEKVQRLQKA